MLDGAFSVVSVFGLIPIDIITVFRRHPMPLPQNTLNWLKSRNYHAIDLGDGTYKIGGPGDTKFDISGEMLPNQPACFNGVLIDCKTRFPLTEEPKE
jgi:hypothetical protein